VKNDNQPSVQLPISFKMPKQLAQFFASKSGKTPDSSKIKLEALMFEPRPGLLSNEPVHEANLDDKNKDETSDEIEEVLEIIKKQVKNFMKRSVGDSSSSYSFSSSDESDHQLCKKCSKHHHHHHHDTEFDSDSNSDYDISLKY